MKSAKKILTNFSHARSTQSICFRPQNEEEIAPLFEKAQDRGILARGWGLSYGDGCFNDHGLIVDMTRLNRLLDFDEAQGILTAEPGTTFKDLFFHPNFIPPVIPGTLYSTLGGAVANDVHGKNNHREGTLSHHILKLVIQVNNQTYHLSPNQDPDLFYATLGGLGLTGIIKEITIKLKKASHFVQVQQVPFSNLEKLLSTMTTDGLAFDYQVAWVDLLNQPKAILFLANHAPINHLSTQPRPLYYPKIPFRMITRWNIRLFNQLYYYLKKQSKKSIALLQQFNNPLDFVKNWNYVYGKSGLLQFQAVFDVKDALSIIEQLQHIIKINRATPTLSVLKYFTKAGLGLLSFAEKGFTLAIDFINNEGAKRAIPQMNHLISERGGKIYLAKDLFLTREEFQHQYPKYDLFVAQIKKHPSLTQSDLGRRLGLIL